MACPQTKLQEGLKDSNTGLSAYQSCQRMPFGYQEAESTVLTHDKRQMQILPKFKFHKPQSIVCVFEPWKADTVVADESC